MKAVQKWSFARRTSKSAVSYILDEFQDTNAEQWYVVKALGAFSQLIALADPEQRIFDFIGADPERLNHFREEFQPSEIDFSDANHRSAGTDIAKFGNDILTGKFQLDSYKGIELAGFDPVPKRAMTKLVTTTYRARARLVASGIPDWSLAILVPTKRMTRLVSDNFREPPAGMQAITHSAVVELEAAILGSEIIAHLLQPEVGRHVDAFVDLLCNFYQGKGGSRRPTKTALDEAARLRKAYDKWCAALAAGKEPPATNVLRATFKVCEEVRAIQLTGDPDKD